ncbi:MAG: hypothetical protein K2X87_05120 [Gemmataceae bacterium]|nr:hypothetical protein [Gemmataceae bacterium]
MLHLITLDLATLAIAGLYYTWRDVIVARRKQTRVRERVALMLWAVAARAA